MLYALVFINLIARTTANVAPVAITHDLKEKNSVYDLRGGAIKTAQEKEKRYIQPKHADRAQQCYCRCGNGKPFPTKGIIFIQKHFPSVFDK